LLLHHFIEYLSEIGIIQVRSEKIPLGDADFAIFNDRLDLFWEFQKREASMELSY